MISSTDQRLVSACGLLSSTILLQPKLNFSHQKKSVQQDVFTEAKVDEESAVNSGSKVLTVKTEKESPDKSSDKENVTHKQCVSHSYHQLNIRLFFYQFMYWQLPSDVFICFAGFTGYIFEQHDVYPIVIMISFVGRKHLSRMKNPREDESRCLARILSLMMRVAEVTQPSIQKSRQLLQKVSRLISFGLDKLADAFIDYHERIIYVDLNCVRIR